jgi:Ca-activated chloride channel homolog
MTDDLDALKAALRAPAPDPEARAKALRLAMENFDRLQGSTNSARPTPDRPQRAGFIGSLIAMFKGLKTKHILAATTSVAAVLVGVAVLPALMDKAPRTLPADPPEVIVVTPDQVQDALTPEPKKNAEELASKPTEAPEPKLADKAVSAGEAQRKSILDQAIKPRPCVGVCVNGSARLGTESSETAPPASELPAPLARQTITFQASGETDGTLSFGRVADSAVAPELNTEAFANATANPLKITAEEPVSTFSIDVDTASYAVVRSSLNAGHLPDPASVRIEEMVNYFPYAYPKPEGDAAFRPTITVMPTPWNPGTRLVSVAIQGAMPAVEARPPLNLVFLIDTSGSMQDANKLPLLKQSLGLMLGQLRPQDQVAIVAYAGSAGLVLPPTSGSDTAAIQAALNRLDAGGSTAGAEGLELAYQTAASMAGQGEVSRVLLATDGDFNVGIADPEALKTYIAAKRESGTYLSVLGFGRGNLDDATMQALAQNGNGTASYIDTLNEARKVLVDQVAGALYPIADNVKIQVEWNPAQVAEYRLIGYETRALAREDFNNDKVDAGEIGAGTQVTALYEVTAPDSPALRNDPLRYATPEAGQASAELGYLRLRWMAPGASTSQLQETPIVPGMPPTAEARFAAAIAGFGQLLTGGKYLGSWGWDQAIDLALSARGEDRFGYRIEAVNLMRSAKALSVR